MKAGSYHWGGVASHYGTAALLVLLVWLCTAAGSGSGVPEELAKVPEDGKPGESAGRLNISGGGVAADPNFPGHVYVADRLNQRISEFDPWGTFVKAWGWGVKNGNAELQSCTEETGCRKGIAGSGDGQLDFPEAIAVDGKGDVYVIEAENKRIQKFDPAGAGGNAEFIAKFGESGPGALTTHKFAYLRRLAVCPKTEDVYVGEAGSEAIRRFESDGTFLEEIKGGALSGNVEGLGVDSECHLYAAFAGDSEIHKLKGSGPSGQALTPSFKAENTAERPKSVAVDGDGDVYVGIEPFGEGKGAEPAKVQEYGADGSCKTCGGDGEEGLPGFDRSPETQIEDVAASGGACNADDAYTTHFKASPAQSFFKAYGTPPDPALCPQPQAPPEITAQFTRSAETEKAELAAEINPRFWDSTEYRLEYGTSECKSGGCTTTTAPVQLTTKVLGHSIPTDNVFLEGLEEGTTYHYRFVAESCFEEEAGECTKTGGPTYGLDPDGREGPKEASFAEGAEGTFTTYRKTVATPCPANEAFRSGASARLADCRAYEMVSPLDKEGGDIKVLLETSSVLPAVLTESAADGGRFAFGSYRSFGDAAAAPYTTQYVATRGAGVGWETHAISPPRGKRLVEIAGGFDTELKALSPDLCEAWFESFAEPPLAAGAPAGYPDLYRRQDEECGGATYEALNTAKPPNLKGGPETVSNPQLNTELLGRSEDGRAAIFLANDVLAAGGTAKKTQLYGSREGIERFLCVLPGGAAYDKSCTAGGNTISVVAGRDREANVTGAISADGDEVFWTAASESGLGSGRIYLRQDPFGEGAECSGPGTPCSFDVSKAAEEEAGSTGSQFVAAARDGSRVLFTTQAPGGDDRLYEVRVGEESSPTLIAHQVIGILGQSEDATRVYLASREALGGENDEGREAVPGEANLYFEQGGAFRFIGALSGEDLGAATLSPVAPQPRYRDSRVSPDGLAAAFTSRAAMTGYDNTDAGSAKPCGQVGGICDAEAFVYRAAAKGGEGELICASCNPSGARPQGKRVSEGQGVIQAAGHIPVYEDILYASRALSDDGNRLFFDASDALVPRDSNGKEDVYQWEAPGAGNCTESSSSYSPQNQGCVSLVSSGQSELDSSFLDASPSGDDAFFTTLSSLVPQDYGLVDVYDARVDGGLPSPPQAPPECEAESCQHPPAAPAFQTPSTSSYEGPGNVEQKPKKQKKKKHKHNKHKKKQAKRRAGR